MANQGIGVDFKMVDLFFDRKEVIDNVEKDERRALVQVGAYIRKVARNSLRRRKKSAQPGNPPSVYSRDSKLTLKNILFFYDKQNASVKVGPVQFTQSDDAPGLLELGGVKTVREERRIYPDGRKSSWRRKSVKRPSRLDDWETRTTRYTYSAFPFMGPALERAEPRVLEIFESVGKRN